MNLNAIYLAALAANSNVVAVEVYFKDGNDSPSTRAAPVAPPSAPVPASAAPWQMDANAAHLGEVDHKRRVQPVQSAPKPVRTVFTYLAPKNFDLKEDDAVIVVNDKTGKASIAYVHSTGPIDLDKLNKVASDYSYQHADGHFWKWIVGPVNFEQFNDLNEARVTFLEKAAEVQKNKRAEETRIKLVETYGSETAVNDLFNSAFPVTKTTEQE